MSAKSITPAFPDEAFLRKLERFRLLAKKGLRGPSAGDHLSRRSGVSPDFLEHRKYQRGDDFRYIDWNLYGRLDRIFIKLFRAEEDLTIHLLVDVSRSMAFGNPSKAHFAKQTAAALAYVSLANLDRVGIGAFNDHMIDVRSPRKGSRVFVALIDFLRALAPQGETDLGAAMTQYAAAGGRQGMVVVISDLLDARGVEKGLDILARGRCDAALIQVLDGRELNSALQGDVTMEDMETGRIHKMSIDRRATAAHRRLWRQYLEGIRQACRQRGIGYALCDTRLPFEDFLLAFLLRHSEGRQEGWSCN